MFVSVECVEDVDLVGHPLDRFGSPRPNRSEEGWSEGMDTFAAVPHHVDALSILNYEVVAGVESHGGFSVELLAGEGKRD